MSSNKTHEISYKEIINLILVNCISADNNFDINSCSNSLNSLKMFEDLLENGELGKKLTENEIKYYKQKIIEARLILNNDIERFKNEQNNKNYK